MKLIRPFVVVVLLAASFSLLFPAPASAQPMLMFCKSTRGAVEGSRVWWMRMFYGCDSWLDITREWWP